MLANTYYARHAEERRQYSRAYHADHPDVSRRASAAWRAAHKEERRQYQAAWYAAHKDQQREYFAEYHGAHTVEHRKRNAAWYLLHLDEERERRKAWRAANPDRAKANKRRHYAFRRGAAVSNLTAAQWARCLTEYNNRCAYCLEPMDMVTQDHMTPLCRGGHHTLSNVVPACRSCNSKKGTLTLLEYVKEL
jgi:5-methylcytosine-specific restriction endonuclease McrA